MALPGLSDDLKDFIVLCIPSVPFLEAVLLMRGDRQQPWDVQRLAQALYVDEASAARLLQDLHEAEVLVPCIDPAEGYRYEPASRMFSERIEQLADLYKRHVVQVSKLIHLRDRPRHLA